MKLVDVTDRIANIIITFGGIFIILSVLGIIVFIGAGALPLVYKAKASDSNKIPFSTPKDNSAILLTGQDELREIGYIVRQDGQIDFLALSANPHREKGELIKSVKLENLDEGERITAASQSLLGDIVGLGTGKGKVIILKINFIQHFTDAKRTIIPELEENEPLLIIEDESPIRLLSVQRDEEGAFGIAANTGDHGLFFLKFSPDDIGEPEVQDLSQQIDAAITSLAVNRDLNDLILALQGGTLEYFDISDPEDIVKNQSLQTSGGTITATGFLIGGESLVAGYESGDVAVFFKIRQDAGEWNYSLVRKFKPHSSAVLKVSASPRNKGFLTADKTGNIKLNYNTTGKTLFDINVHNGPINAVNFAPRANGCLSADSTGTVKEFTIKNHHPEATAGSLFGEIWYEGYSKPEFVWQSTGMSEAFESKISLIPLIFGTFKGSFYAMIFSVPLAVLAALYLSQLAPTQLRNTIKPIIELMAAMPSVLVGFLAGLWLAPLVDKNVAGSLLNIPIIPFFAIIIMFIWLLFSPRRIVFKDKSSGHELLLLAGVVVLGVIISYKLGKPLEGLLFGGDFKQWLFSYWGTRYDPRNCLVVGFALGFAVIPIIFTISEDAMSNVPPSLTSASLALGASRWQTAWNIVLPASASGLFAAVMLGFGRAVGETMIVLMATGNTPILDMSIFNGMRTMSACIAVEIPEAPQGETLYRVLFLTGFLLFIFTFLINTAAEMVGRHLRKKYGRF